MIPEPIVQLAYLVSASLFIIGLRWLSSAKTARNGNAISGVGMVIAIVVTLFDREIVTYGAIAAGILVGSAIGIWMARTVKMTAMPQMVSILIAAGGAASLLVGAAALLRAEVAGESLHMGEAIAIQLDLLIGAVTFTGSVIAYAKLQEIMTGQPIIFPGLKWLNPLLFLVIVGLSVYQLVTPPPLLWPFMAVITLSLILGVLLVIPIGGADMPVVISLLNSYSGLAAAMTGFVIQNQVLIIAGAMVGSSGIILSQIMCRAMNRSLANVLFGAFGAAGASATRSSEGMVAKQASVDDVAIQLAYARLVLVIPGYGLAVAQAQHQIRELAELIEKEGGEVKYAIHPVAGRMPGHMNVLLSEANVPYDRLITDVDEANAVAARSDVAIVIGANDIVNPAALDDPASPIYGMPIIRSDLAARTIIMKRSMASGFSGIENDLFYREKSYMLFGDAKSTLNALIGEIKQELGAAA